jgi:hypothetical protein
MAGIVACGDDSSSNGGGSKELPKSVPTFMDLGDIECNADRKCEKIVVEESNDTYQCDGVMQWNKLLEGFPSTVCPTEENKGNEVIDNTEGSEGDVVGSSDSNVEGNVIGSSDSNVEGDFVASSDSGDSTESSSSSEENVVISSSSESGPKAMVSCDNISEEGQQRLGTMGEKCTEFEAGSMAASALELRCEDYGGTLGTGCPAKSEEDIGSSSSAEVTGPTGDLVSCVIEFMGGKTCDEVSKAEEAAFTADCNMVGGTMNTAGGCNAAEYAAKCVCEGVNHYDSSCEGVICRN